MSCGSCHAPAAGWTFPNSDINQRFGPVPGIVPGRFGNRRPPTVSYTAFLANGIPTFVPAAFSYVGGLFYDGRAASLEAQAPFPLQNPNEMNNTPAGVVKAVAGGPNARLFQQAFNIDIATLDVNDAFDDIVKAIVAFEESTALSPFNSKYDAFAAGKAQLSSQEMAGLQLFTGTTTGRPGGPANHKNAQCSVCHPVQTEGSQLPDLFTEGAYQNTGGPKNPNNPFYRQTNASADPLGFNPLGAAYIDFGLGDFLYPHDSLPSGNIGAGSNGQGDFLKINGVFKIPTLRNVDLRPAPGFVKCYSHNGFFKSLKQLVHFYNTRNLTTVPGEVINFTLPNPYNKLRGRPIWPAPENPSPVTLVNPTGASAAAGGLVGNLGLSDQEEDDIVAFLRTLSDGSGRP
jgi:cytochrome c peroxidase